MSDDFGIIDESQPLPIRLTPPTDGPAGVYHPTPAVYGQVAEPFPLPPHESHLEPRPTRCICCGEPMEMYPMCPRCKAEKKAHELFTGTGEP